MIGEKTKLFAIRIINLYKFLTISAPLKEFVMSKQVLKSGTSIGANVREALRGQSTADFRAKMNISLKEACETEYWLELLERAEIRKDETVSALLHDCGSIRRLLISSINTAKQNTETK